MNHWHDHDTSDQLDLGEELMDGVDALIHGWQQASSQFIGRICTGAERWQAKIREIQAPANLADILRARISH
jgi:hypothetical protein